MKTTCPACGAMSSLDVLIGHEGAREAVVVSLSLYGPLGPLVVQYLGLFRPPQRNLSMSRVASLLLELKPMIQDAKIKRGGRICAAPQDYWVMAITEMLAKRDSLTLPLKSHGYLLAIIEGYDIKAASKTESQKEAVLAGRTPVSTPASHRAFKDAPAPPKANRSVMPDAVKAAIKKTVRKATDAQ